MTPIALLVYTVITLGVIDLLAWFILFYRFEAGFSRAPKLYNVECKSAVWKVAAIVAARNEEETIAECIRSLLSQSCTESVIVVDDGSTDKTYEMATNCSTDSRVHILRVDGKGLGKAEACFLAASRVTEADWLLFVDADTRIKPGFVDCALRFAEDNGLDALSAVGQLRCPHLWDKVSTPFLFGLLNSFIRLDHVCNRKRKSAYFYGSFILIKKEAYTRIGGHRAVKHDIVEDRALGSLAKRSGLNICIVRALDAVSAEWAPGFRSSIDAMRRVVVPSINGRLGLGSTFGFALTALFFIPLLLVGVCVSGVGHISSNTSTLGLALGLSSLALSATLSASSAKKIGSNPLPALLFILPEIAFSYAFWSSVHRILRGKPVVWRDRAYLYRRK
ncbi:MAG: glycosyltransferase family 2 protein [Thermoprotei archaeon]